MGLVVAGLTFGLLHGQLRFLPVSLLGILMGYTVMRTNSVLPGILAHSCNNALALILAFSIRPEFLSFPCLAGCIALGGSGLVVSLNLFRKSTFSSSRISKMAPGSTPTHGIS